MSACSLEETIDYYSGKTRQMSFWAIVTVVLIHSRTCNDGSASWNIFLQTFLNRGLSDWAVPFFFAVSGFWFGKNIERFDGIETLGKWYKGIIGKKTQSLIVPYLLWAIIGSAIVLPLTLVNNIISHKPLLERTFLSSGKLWGCIDELIGITTAGPWGCMPMWFVRVLIIFFILSPIVLALRKTKLLYIIIGILLACFKPEINCLSLPIAYIGWMCIGVGCWFYKGKIRRENVNVALTYLSGGGYVASALLYAGNVAEYWELGTFATISKRSIPLFGITFLWMIYERIKCKVVFPDRVTHYVFWIFCFHQYVTSYIMAISFFLVGKSDMAALLTMFVCLPFGVVVSVMSGMLFEHIMPKFYTLLCGGR